MSLVNLDGTSILGAGSEWFWSMAQFVLVAVSLVGIYLQLRAQRASTVSELAVAWEEKLSSEPFMLTRLQALIDYEGRTVEQGMSSAGMDVANFFEQLGYLLPSKHVRAADVWHSFRIPIGDWWALFEPYIRKSRADLGAPAVYEWFEQLEEEMRRLDVKAFGHAMTFDNSPEGIGRSIDLLRARLQRAHDARNGVFPDRRPAPEPPAA